MSIWKDGIMGVVVGDALGCPVQFESRDEVMEHIVTGMRGYGTFNMPEGSWTDDSSETLALLDSSRRKGGIDLVDIMENLVRWLDGGAFTPFGHAYDIGFGVMDAVRRYKMDRDVDTCGSASERNNGNGSLMRILPAALYCWEQGLPEGEAIEIIRRVGSLTHRHIRANIACGLYYFLACAILSGGGTLRDRLRAGLAKGFAFYDSALGDRAELRHFDRLRDLDAFADTHVDDIRSTGYVVHTLEASVWVLANTDDFEDALLRAVNLGDDTDTTGAVAGGLAGLYYGYDAIPGEWLAAIQRREWIEEMCQMPGADGDR